MVWLGRNKLVGVELVIPGNLMEDYYYGRKHEQRRNASE